MPSALKQSIQDALEAYSPLRTSRAEIAVTVNDGTVTLSGYAPSTSIRDMAAILAGSVDGVGEVVNDVWAAPELERSVALALAQDERTRPWFIRVRAEGGYVQLQGELPDDQAIETALEVARKVKGPKKVVSALKARERLPEAA
jgi:osmotically-inducible protein OsmY